MKIKNALVKNNREPSSCSPTCPILDKCGKVVCEVYARTNESEVDLLFYGMGAGEKEEESRHPFTGPAGKRLRQILEYMYDSMGAEFSFALSNNVRFRPTLGNKNREPTNEEIGWCKGNIIADINNLNPLAIIPLGLSAFSTFIDSPESMTALHGRIHDLQPTLFDPLLRNFVYMPTFHPSFIIRRNGKAFDTPTELDLMVIDDIITALNKGREHGRS
jgi:uracil-DNA glycosylase family 4